MNNNDYMSTLKQLREIKRKQDAGDHDLETHHEEADEILLRYIGLPEITVAFEQINKWYA